MLRNTPSAWPHLLACAAVVLSAATSVADGPTGEQLYKARCASCHGKAGEGAKAYPKPLVGDKSVAQLARVIADTMPEDNPGSLSGPEAEAVAGYVSTSFYSPTARERNRPARVELARLTVRQYRNAVADVVGGFRGQPKPDDRRGLAGEYFNGRGFRGDKRVLERVDPEVKFDFGTGSPADKIDAGEFAVRWSGAVTPPETGEYEFNVRTDQGARLWVNDPNRPLVDAWVQSGADLDHKATVFLLGGRAVPLRLEFAKAKQGVNDGKKVDKPASVSLLWKRPHQPADVVPARFLSPGKAAEVFAVNTPFPPDDRSLGWERGTSVSKEWDQAATDAAFDTAAYVAAHLQDLAGTDPNAPDGKKLREFAGRFAERAFRRPLSNDQKALLDKQFAGTDPVQSLRRSVLLTLLSPRFLFREVGGGPDAYDTAARLSFALWDSIPDQDLLNAAAAGKLSTKEQVAAHAERMLADPRGKAKLRDFLLTWLRVDQPPDMTKDPKKFPGFDAAVAADLRASLELLLDDVAWGSGDFRELLLSDKLFLNGRLAKFYGAGLPADAPFQKVPLDPGKRSGVVTHPYLLATFAYTATSSPIHRGVFVSRGLLGLNLRPPPEAFTPLAADLHPTLTTRERVALQTKPAACVGCHGIVNPLGFALENFDAVGRYRERDNNKPVDSTGGYLAKSGQQVKFTGAADLAKFLAGSDEVQAAFAEQLFHHLAQQPVRAYGPTAAADLRQGFAAANYNVRKLAVQVATTAAIKPRGP